MLKRGNSSSLFMLLVGLIMTMSMPRAGAAAPGPTFEYPQDGQTIDFEGSYLFKVHAVANAQGYLWGFFQNDTMVWENLRDEGHLSPNEYSIVAGSVAHSKFVPGAIQVWVRVQIADQWSDATIITIHLEPHAAPSTPTFEYPQDGQAIDLEGSYLFKVHAVANAQGYLWGFFQNDTMVWENLRDEGRLSTNEYSIVAGSVAHSKFVPGAIQVWVRVQIADQWSDATVITLYLRSRPAQSGPIFEIPQSGQVLDSAGVYLFRVRPLANAQGYLWGFIQNGALLWENLRDEGQLSSYEYRIAPGTPAHTAIPLGEIQVSVRAKIAGEWTNATVITIHIRAIQVPVLQLAYYPPDPNNPSYLDPQETGWSNIKIADMQAATQAMVDAARILISNATRYHGYHNPDAPRFLEYVINDTKEYFIPMPRGYQLGGTEYRPNYGQILHNLNICDYVDNHGVKEVWIYGYHSNFIVPDESKMSSAYGDISNAYPKDELIPAQYRLPRCTNSYVMYNFTYQPGGANAIANTIHNRMHQIENVIFFAENRGYPPDDANVTGSVFWDDFAVYGQRAQLPNYRASCGNTHAAPNTTVEYTYDSQDYRDNNCETWHPDDRKTTYVNTNCQQWGCTDIGFYKWFMQSIPGYKNGIVYQDRQMRNWWEAMYDFNQFIKQGRSLYFEQRPELSVNYPTGRAGSFFTIHGHYFPPNVAATVQVNGRAIGAVTAGSDGSITFVLDTSGARIGTYIVTLQSNMSAAVTPSTTNALFALIATAPFRPREPNVPGPILYPSQRLTIYLPFIRR
jgi:hypothetical protein